MSVRILSSFCSGFHAEGVAYTKALFPISVRALGTSSITRSCERREGVWSDTFMLHKDTQGEWDQPKNDLVYKRVPVTQPTGGQSRPTYT